jgi:hypothetical protein
MKEMAVQKRFSASCLWCQVEPSDLMNATMAARTMRFKQETTGAQYKNANTTNTQKSPTMRKRSLTNEWSSIRRVLGSFFMTFLMVPCAWGRVVVVVVVAFFAAAAAAVVAVAAAVTAAAAPLLVLAPGGVVVVVVGV